MARRLSLTYSNGSDSAGTSPSATLVGNNDDRTIWRNWQASHASSSTPPPSGMRRSTLVTLTSRTPGAAYANVTRASASPRRRLDTDPMQSCTGGASGPYSQNDKSASLVSTTCEST